jgi:hypothetical protein
MIVVINEQTKHKIMVTVWFGKKQGFAPEACRALADRVELALNIIGFTAVFADGLMAISGKNVLVRLPEITERRAASIGSGNASPQLHATGLTAITSEIGNYLTGAPTQGHPDPTFVRCLEYKGPRPI